MPKTDFQGVSEQLKAGPRRLDDARVLLNLARWRGSMYMAGYAIECLLKAKLMQKFGCRNLTELEKALREKGVMAADQSIFTHQLEILLKWSGGADRLRQNPSFWKSFNMANRWVPAWRYSPDPSETEEARVFIEAVESIVEWIRSNL